MKHEFCILRHGSCGTQQNSSCMRHASWHTREALRGRFWERSRAGRLLCGLLGFRDVSPQVLEGSGHIWKVSAGRGTGSGRLRRRFWAGSGRYRKPPGTRTRTSPEPEPARNLPEPLGTHPGPAPEPLQTRPEPEPTRNRNLSRNQEEMFGHNIYNQIYHF